MGGMDSSAFTLSTGSGELREREVELAALETAIVDAKAGESRVVLIEGPAGIGKTRLLQEARKRAAQAGFKVLTARGNEFEREFPFGVVRQIFEPEFQAGRLDMSGSAEPARAIFDAAPGEAPAAGDGAMFAVLNGLFWLVAGMSEDEPLMLAVDDLQWADRPSLHFLAYLSRRLETLPVIVIASLRPAESSADSAIVRELMSDPRRLSVLPAPLTESAVAEITGARLGVQPDAAFAAACHEATGGNPLLLEEMLKEFAIEHVTPTAGAVEKVREIGPRAASRAVLLRLARLPRECVQVARVLTVLGEGAPLSAVAELAAVDETLASDAIKRATQVEILRPEAPIGFVHPLVREAVYRDVPPGERELLHERAARMLSQANAPTERVAAQLLHVPSIGDRWIVQTLRAAAAEAQRRGALSSAVAYLARALEEPPAAEDRADVLRDLGLAEALTNNPACVEHLSQAYEQTPDPVMRGWLAFALARVLGFADRPVESAALLDRATADLSDEHDALRRRLHVVRLSTSCANPAVVPLKLIDDAIDGIDETTDAIESRMLDGVVSYGMTMRNKPASDVERVALRAVGDGSLFTLDAGGFSMMAAMIVLALADSDQAVPVCEQALAAAHKGASVMAPAAARAFKGFALTLHGELPEAIELLESAMQDVRQFNIIVGFSQIASYLALAGVEKGDFDYARERLDEVEQYLPEGTQRSWWLTAKLQLAVERGDNEQAVALADELASRYGDQILNPAWLPWRSLKAQALGRLGRGDEALALVDEEVELARAWGAPRALGRALRIRGQMKRKEGIDDIEAALSLLAASNARLEYARALAAKGTALRHDRKATEAREPLEQALKLASIGGAEGLVAHIRDEIAATGASPRVKEFEGLDSLTPSERRVAGLAIEGNTNREIAQTLFVTPKTVEVHLSNVYRKLDIRSRRELPDVFAAA
ncbi:MAG: AAA family ATPase [Actinobacteria bacterium]|nr:AAA family ATPase [Actinomycetota bacterium]